MPARNYDKEKFYQFAAAREHQASFDRIGFYALLSKLTNFEKQKRDLDYIPNLSHQPKRDDNVREHFKAMFLPAVVVTAIILFAVQLWPIALIVLGSGLLIVGIYAATQFYLKSEASRLYGERPQTEELQVFDDLIDGVVAELEAIMAKESNSTQELRFFSAVPPVVEVPTYDAVPPVIASPI